MPLVSPLWFKYYYHHDGERETALICLSPPLLFMSKVCTWYFIVDSIARLIELRLAMTFYFILFFLVGKSFKVKNIKQCNVFSLGNTSSRLKYLSSFCTYPQQNYKLSILCNIIKVYKYDILSYKLLLIYIFIRKLLE